MEEKKERKDQQWMRPSQVGKKSDLTRQSCKQWAKGKVLFITRNGRLI